MITLQGYASAASGWVLALYFVSREKPQLLGRTDAIVEDGGFAFEVENDSLARAVRAVEAQERASSLVLRAGDLESELPLKPVSAGLRRGLMTIDLGKVEFGETKVSAEVAVLQKELAEVTRRAEGAALREQRLQGELSEVQNRATDFEGRLSRTSSELDVHKRQNETLTVQLRDTEAEVKRLEDVLNTPEQPSHPVPLNNVLESLSDQIADTAERVQSRNGPWRLSDVRFSLKVLMDGQGKDVRFPKLGEVTPGTAEFSAIDFTVRRTPGPRAESDSISVPSLVGYTTVVAERKLQSVGLLGEISYETVNDVESQPKRAGRVVRQRPEAGTAVSRGSRVELLVGKA